MGIANAQPILPLLLGMSVNNRLQINNTTQDNYDMNNILFVETFIFILLCIFLCVFYYLVVQKNIHNPWFKELVFYLLWGLAYTFYFFVFQKNAISPSRSSLQEFLLFLYLVLSLACAIFFIIGKVFINWVSKMSEEAGNKLATKYWWGADGPEFLLVLAFIAGFIAMPFRILYVISQVFIQNNS